ncbi:MAG TPA: epoxyqueuosine reductase [Deltaproteobacteria bacterium]|nr:epoxyqueuosine reductase [Deltaproteobacteria bacterium]HPR52593.1 epoxyqueuosine reductase [Deltaproteobacteria bacterium]
MQDEKGIASERIRKLIRDFLSDPEENRLFDDGDERAWADPLVGFSRADDPIFVEFKRHIGTFIWTPQEAFAQAYPHLDVIPAELAVISWILPQTPATRADNRREESYPCERWARSRIFGEEINTRLKTYLVNSLCEAGYEAVCPTLLPNFSWQNSDTYGFASNWSERHAAYACGLGTFGLCDGLITAYGKAMRAGSVIARIEIPPMQRPYNHHHEYCLYYVTGGCKKCMERCPAGAITEAGHDKVRCFSYLTDQTSAYVKTRYGFDGYGCGLCQTGVPCESGIPEKNRSLTDYLI